MDSKILASVLKCNKRNYTREEILPHLKHLETWIRASGWSNLYGPICKDSKTVARVFLPAQCIMDIVENVPVGALITTEMTQKYLLPYLYSGISLATLANLKRPSEVVAADWGKGALEVYCYVFFDNQGHYAYAWLRFYPMCGVCKKHEPGQVKSRCSGCRVTCYCSEECQKSHWKTHKDNCKKLRSTYDALIKEK